MSKNFEYVRSDGHDVVRIAARGRDVLTHPMTNFGTAFTRDQRERLGLVGLLPPGVVDINGQLRRIHDQYLTEPTDMARYVFLNTLKERNEILFYRLVSEHIEQMLPIIYTPTIGRAIEEYSHWFHRPRGVFIDIDHPEDMTEALLAYGYGPDEVDLIVVTDSEGILGIGDQGVGGVSIAVGKLAVYTAAAGIRPDRVLPVVLDTGTNNLELLNDDCYLGVRHSRVRGRRYDDFIEQFVRAVGELFPHAMLHWEDFGASNAHRILSRYRADDVHLQRRHPGHGGRRGLRGAGRHQALRGADRGAADRRLRRGHRRHRHQRPARAGHGRAGTRRRGGAPPLLGDGKPASDVVDWPDAPHGHGLDEVVHRVRPTMLIGCSAQSGAFTERVVREMASHQERPIIMPLSNPTSKAEALPADLLEWTDGRALIATGSPFEPIAVGGTRYEIAQANNALVFPGIGLGTIAVEASRVSDGMILAAATCLARSGARDAEGASLLPSIHRLRVISAKVGLAVAQQAIDEGLARVVPDDTVQAIADRMWRAEYPEVEVVDQL